MTTFTITLNEKNISVEIEETEIESIVSKKIETLLAEVNSLKASSDDFMTKHITQKAVAKYTKKEDGKVVFEDLPETVNYSEIKTATAKRGLAGYLAENGIEKTLHGSANRGYLQAKAVVDALKSAGITDEAVLKASAINTLGDMAKASWKVLVIAFLFAE